MVDLLIGHGADINVIDDGWQSPLHLAVESRLPQLVDLLLANGADPNLHRTGEVRRNSLLEDALECNNINAAESLYRCGGRINFLEMCPMHRAAGNARLEILLWLIEKGGDTNQRNEYGETPLLCAAYGHDQVIAALCERKADVTVVNAKGQGVLHLAATWAPALKLFLKRELDLNARDKEGLTPLHYAARNAADETIPILISEGADVNAQDDSGNTPLHIIFFGEEFRPDIEFPTFKALVDGGAEKAIKKKAGETAFDLAQKYQYPSEYLELLALG